LRPSPPRLLRPVPPQSQVCIGACSRVVQVFYSHIEALNAEIQQLQQEQAELFAAAITRAGSSADTQISRDADDVRPTVQAPPTVISVPKSTAKAPPAGLVRTLNTNDVPIVNPPRGKAPPAHLQDSPAGTAPTQVAVIVPDNLQTPVAGKAKPPPPPLPCTALPVHAHNPPAVKAKAPLPVAPSSAPATLPVSSPPATEDVSAGASSILSHTANTTPRSSGGALAAEHAFPPNWPAVLGDSRRLRRSNIPRADPLYAAPHNPVIRPLSEHMESQQPPQQLQLQQAPQQQPQKQKGVVWLQVD